MSSPRPPRFWGDGVEAVPPISLENLHEIVRQRAAERKSGTIGDTNDRLQEMALDWEEEEGVLGSVQSTAGRKRQRCDSGREEEGGSTRVVPKARGEERERWKLKRKKRRKVESNTQEDLSVDEILLDEQGSGESSESDSDREGEEMEDPQTAWEEAMDTGGTEGSGMVTLGHVGARSVGKVSVRRQLPEWVQHAELVEADIAGHSHPIEEFPLARVIIRNLRRMAITQLFPVQVSVGVGVGVGAGCGYEVWVGVGVWLCGCVAV